MQGTVVSVDVAVGDAVVAGQQLLVLESMKMEHVIAAEQSGVITAVSVVPGQTVYPGDALIALEPTTDFRSVISVSGSQVTESPEVVQERADLAEVVERHAVGMDDRRPDAVARRRKTGQRTTR